MEKKDKILIFVGLAMIIIATIAVVLTFVSASSSAKNEPFEVNPSSGNKIMTSDINGNIALYTTNRDSILLTDSNGSMKNLPFPKGLIMIWHNNKTVNPTNDDLAPGWSLCDGGTYNGYTTPDLRGRFVLGAGQGPNLTNRTVGVIGGQEKVALDIQEMPKHSHSYNARVRGNEDGSNRWTLAEGDTRWTDPSGGMADGKTKPHENMPPFYILCYICYTGVGL